MNNTIKASLLALTTVGFLLLNKTTRDVVTNVVKKCQLIKLNKSNVKFKPEQISFC